MRDHLPVILAFQNTLLATALQQMKLTHRLKEPQDTALVLKNEGFYSRKIHYNLLVLNSIIPHRTSDTHKVRDKPFVRSIKEMLVVFVDNCVTCLINCIR